MGCKETLDVGGTVNLDVVTGLGDINAIEGVSKTKVGQGRLNFAR